MLLSSPCQGTKEIASSRSKRRIVEPTSALARKRIGLCTKMERRSEAAQIYSANPSKH